MPPAYRTEALIPLEMPATALRYGIDPESLSITEDGVLRYVVVAQSKSGSVNALYEGLNCKTWQVMTYARSTAIGQWHQAREPQWQPLGSGRGTQHAIALSRQGACEGARLSATNVPELLRRLRSP